jgi:low temperature requirement protein LtrA
LAAATREGWLRDRRDGEAAVRPIELFFDLVYVLAITQLTHHLLDHLTLHGAAETLLLLLAVWAAWNFTSWTTNYFEPGAPAVRVALLALMFASLAMSSAIPEAFDHRALLFAAAYVALTIGRTLFALVGFGGGHPLRRVFSRPLVWWSLAAVLWIAGAASEGDARFALWALAVAIEYTGLMLGYPVPRLGRTLPSEYAIAGEHMAERCLLFITLSLGESILIVGANVGELPGTFVEGSALVVAFTGTIALWWIYFDRSAEAGKHLMSTSADPGRFALSAYTWAHIPMVAGIIVAAVADDLVIEHPSDGVGTAVALTILGGPALYLIGNCWFQWALWDSVPRSRLAGLVALAAIIPVAALGSRLLLLAAATAVLAVLAIRDTRSAGAPLADAATPAG